MGGVCRRFGHFVNDEHSRYCRDHGAPLINECTTCQAPLESFEEQMGKQTAGKFCNNCGNPAEWATRDDLYTWIGDLVNEEGLPRDELLKLRELIQQLRQIDLSETKAVAIWDWIRKMAPKTWEKIRPFLPLLASESVRKSLGLPF